MIRLSGQLRVEPVLDQQMLLDAVDLDLDGAGADRHRLGERAAVLDAQVLDRPQRGARRAADVVGPGLEAVELLDDGERDHERGVAERRRQCGSAISTDVSTTQRVRLLTPRACAMSLRARASPERRSVTVTSDVCDRPGSPGWRRTEPTTRIVVPQSRPAVVDAVRHGCTSPGPSTSERPADACRMRVLRCRRRPRRRASRCSATTSRWRSSTSRRCSPGTRWSFRCGMS